MPARLPIEPVQAVPGPAGDLFGHARAPRRAPRKSAGATPSTPQPHDWGPVAELEYETGPATFDPTDNAHASGPYEPWRAGTICFPGAVEHPTPLVQSGAMAAVPHPAPSYRPMLPTRIVTEGLLSDAQLESVVLAGQAHERHLAALYRIGAGWETVHRVDRESDDADDDGRAVHARPDDDDDSAVDNEPLSAPVPFRRGWMLGDGTGCGKGRQVAAIILDQLLRGRKRALWLSQSDKLLEDTRRDWTAIGGRGEDVIPLAKVRQGADIPQAQGILFATYATLRSPARQGKQSRLDQIVAWLAGGPERGRPPRLLGRHRLRRGACDGERRRVQGLARRRRALAAGDGRACACRTRIARRPRPLCLRHRRHHRAQALPTQGVSASGLPARHRSRNARRSSRPWRRVVSPAMEVVARDLKALGLYQARALSYDGIEVDILEHPLSDEQRRILRRLCRCLQDHPCQHPGGA